MKDLMVLAASIILGVYIFTLVAGNEGSIKAALKESFQSEIKSRNYLEMVDKR